MTASLQPSTPPPTAREKLLRAALELFSEHGLDGTTTRDIAKLAGQNIALISYHFGGKEQLYHELLRSLPTKGVLLLAPEIYEAVASSASRKRITPEQARSMLKMLMHRIIIHIFSKRETLLVARLLIREHTKPTSGFEILYLSGIERTHKAVTALFAIASGRNPEKQDTIIRAHMLLGQMLSFIFAYTPICRRLGKTSLEGRTLETIATILEENIDTLCRPAHV